MTTATAWWRSRANRRPRSCPPAPCPDPRPRVGVDRVGVDRVGVGVAHHSTERARGVPSAPRCRLSLRHPQQRQGTGRRQPATKPVCCSPGNHRRLPPGSAHVGPSCAPALRVRHPGLERETGIAPATCSLEGRDARALQHRPPGPERNVSSCRVVARGAALPKRWVTMAAVAPAGPWHDGQPDRPEQAEPLYLGRTMSIGGRL